MKTLYIVCKNAHWYNHYGKIVCRSSKIKKKILQYCKVISLQLKKKCHGFPSVLSSFHRISYINVFHFVYIQIQIQIQIQNCSPANQLLHIYLKEIKLVSQRDICNVATSKMVLEQSPKPVPQAAILAGTCRFYQPLSPEFKKHAHWLKGRLRLRQ